jgi:hypothetical protein
MKKGILISGLMSLLSISLISAATGDEVLRNVANGFTKLLEGIGIGKFNLGVNGLSMILLGILLWIVLYSIIKQIFSLDSGWASAGISLIITIITFIALPENFISAIVTQYGAMGATILTVIPLIILLYFTVVVTKKKFMAMIIWLFYTMYYFALFIYKIGKSNSPIFSVDNLPYLGAILVGIIIIVMLGVLRKKVFTAVLDSEVEEAMRGVKIREATRDIEEAEGKSYGVTGTGSGRRKRTA